MIYSDVKYEKEGLNMARVNLATVMLGERQPSEGIAGLLREK